MPPKGVPKSVPKGVPGVKKPKSKKFVVSQAAKRQYKKSYRLACEIRDMILAESSHPMRLFKESLAYEVFEQNIRIASEEFEKATGAMPVN